MDAGKPDPPESPKSVEVRDKLVAVSVLRDAVEEAEGFTVTNRDELSVIP